MKTNVTPKRILCNLDAVITGSTLTVCVVLVNLNVLMRYFLNCPLQWCEEIVTSLFVWTVFIGSAYAYRMHAHLGVDIVVNLMPPRLKRCVHAVMSVVELLVLIMLTIISAQYVYHLVFDRTGELKVLVTDLLRLPKWWTGIAVPLGFGTSAVYSVWFMVRDVLHSRAAHGRKPASAQKGGGTA